MANRLKNFLICLDQFIFNVFTLGKSYPDETMSAASYRLEQSGKILGKVFRPLIDFLFSGFESEHCKKSFESEKFGNHLPKEYK